MKEELIRVLQSLIVAQPFIQAIRDRRNVVALGEWSAVWSRGVQVRLSVYIYIYFSLFVSIFPSLCPSVSSFPSICPYFSLDFLLYLLIYIFMLFFFLLIYFTCYFFVHTHSYMLVTRVYYLPGRWSFCRHSHLTNLSDARNGPINDLSLGLWRNVAAIKSDGTENNMTSSWYTTRYIEHTTHSLTHSPSCQALSNLLTHY